LAEKPQISASPFKAARNIVVAPGSVKKSRLQRNYLIRINNPRGDNWPRPQRAALQHVAHGSHRGFRKIASRARKTTMPERGGRQRKGGPRSLAEIVGRALDPITAKRGFATADLMAGWADIVGSRYAECTMPEKIAWPRGASPDAGAGVLVVRVDGPRALFLQHEADQIVERINGFLGHGAIARLKIVQGRVGARSKATEPASPPLGPQREAELASTLTGVGSDKLREALDRLGRAVLGARDKKT
jgi:hypothetical protein